MKSRLYKKCARCSNYFKDSEDTYGTVEMKFRYEGEPKRITLDLCPECVNNSLRPIAEKEGIELLMEDDYCRNSPTWKYEIYG